MKGYDCTFFSNRKELYTLMNMDKLCFLEGINSFSLDRKKLILGLFLWMICTGPWNRISQKDWWIHELAILYQSKVSITQQRRYSYQNGSKMENTGNKTMLTHFRRKVLAWGDAKKLLLLRKLDSITLGKNIKMTLKIISET